VESEPSKVGKRGTVVIPAALRPKAGLLRLWTLANATLITSDHAIEEARRISTQPGSAPG